MQPRLADHLDEAAGYITKTLGVDMGAAWDHLQLWWAEAPKWASDRPLRKAGAALEDVASSQPSTSRRRGSFPSMGVHPRNCTTSPRSQWNWRPAALGQRALCPYCWMCETRGLTPTSEVRECG